MSSYIQRIEFLQDFFGHQAQIQQQTFSHITLLLFFGSSSSPFMLAAVLDLHFSKSTSPVALDLKANIYVDNILSGCNTEEELLAYYKHSCELMSQANFNLRSWSSNSHQLQTIATRDKTSDPKPTVGLLGLQWNTNTDTVSLAPK